LIFSGDCCTEVTVGGNEVGRVEEHKSKYGNYELQSGTVNGKAHYTALDGKNAIWYTANGYWNVASKEYKGTETTSFKASSSNDCPDSIDNWQYWSKDGNWYDAGTGGAGIDIYCKIELAVDLTPLDYL